MFRTLVSSVLLFASIPALAQSVKMPDRLDLTVGVVKTLKITWQGETFRFYTGSYDLETFAVRIPDEPAEEMTIKILASREGVYKVTAVAISIQDGRVKIGETECIISAYKDGPNPKPPPPKPKPDPPPPVEPDIIPPGDPDDPGIAEPGLTAQIKAAAGRLTAADLKKLAKAHYDASVIIRDLPVSGPTAPQVTAASKVALRDNGFAVTINKTRTLGTEIPVGMIDILGERLGNLLPVTAEKQMTAAEVRTLRKQLLGFTRAMQEAAK